MRHQHGDALWTFGSMGLELGENSLWGRSSGIVDIETDKSVEVGEAQGCVWHKKRKMSRIELWRPPLFKGLVEEKEPVKDPRRHKQKAEGEPRQRAATKTSRGLHKYCGMNE